MAQISAKPSISVVVPVYNSASTLEALVQRLVATLEPLGRAYEVVLVNDGSRDDSWQWIVKLSAGCPRLRGVNLMRNYGQHNALLVGIRSARHAIVVTLDDDLQNPPEEIPRLLDQLDQGFDVVYGTPQQEQHGLWRDLASLVTKLALQSAMGAATARQASTFRAFRTQIRQAFADFSGPFVSIDVLLTWGTTRFTSIRVRHDARFNGASNYTIVKLLAHAVNMMTGFSVLPLQLASLVGFGFTLLGSLLLLYIIGRYVVEGGSVPGFPFLASIIVVFAGAQLFALGIIGEYLARMHFRSMGRPVGAVRGTVDTAEGNREVPS